MEELPSQCNYLNLGAARIREIKSINQKLDECRHGKIAFQNLPRHMQRRATSSNPKRVPRDLRHLQKITQPVEKKKTKRPSRKYRRRPKNLLSEYTRRQREDVWLETHIWHSKRFHMKKKWGYVIPERPTQKAYRSSLRAATQLSLLQDVSYLSCFELHGALSNILSGLTSITDPESCALISSPAAMEGKQWFQITLYKPHKKPFEAVCDVDFLWHPTERDKNVEDINKLWMWVHPVCSKQVTEILVEIFSLNPIGHSKETMNSDFGKLTSEEIKEKSTDIDEWNMSDPILKCKLETRNIPFNRTPKYVSQNGDVTLILLKDTMNRFRLIGPDSHKNINRALHPMKINEREIENDQRENIPDQVLSNEAKEIENIEVIDKDIPWWKKYYEKPHLIEAHKQQVSAWNILGNFEEVTSRYVLPLCVRDPRVTLPVKKNIPLENKALPENEKDVSFPIWPHHSPIFESVYRDAVTASKLPDSEINKQRSSLLVPGSELPESPQESKLPLLMLVAPTTGNGATGVAYDIIVPCGWGMSVWMSLVYNCCATSGQEQEFALHLEANTRIPPHLQPDTDVYQNYSKQQIQEGKEEFFKRPPNCRINLLKLGIQFPFCPPWKKLIQAWSPGVQNYFVLRDSKVLSSLTQLIGNANKQRGINRKRKATSGSEDGLKRHKLKDIVQDSSFEKFNISKETTSNDHPILNPEEYFKNNTIDKNKESAMQDMESENRNNIEDAISSSVGNLSRNCLVTVSLILKGKGIVEPCAMVCLPTEDDLNKYISSRNSKPGTLDEGPIEIMHEDSKAQLRKELKLEHKKMQGTIRRHRKRAAVRAQYSEKENTTVNESVQENRMEGVEETPKSTDTHLEEKYAAYNDLMRATWLMDENTKLQCCSRLIMGYVAHGNFSYSRGRGAGYGWVTLAPLLDAVKVSREVSENYKVTSINNAEKESSTGVSESSTGVSEKKSLVKDEILVLIRNPTTLQYRWARLSIMINNH